MYVSFAAIFDGSLVVTALQLMLRAMETDRKIQICSQILSPWLGDKVDYGIGMSYTGPPAYVAWRAGTTTLCHKSTLSPTDWD